MMAFSLSQVAFINIPFSLYGKEGLISRWSKASLSFPSNSFKIYERFMVCRDANVSYTHSDFGYNFANYNNILPLINEQLNINKHTCISRHIAMVHSVLITLKHLACTATNTSARGFKSSLFQPLILTLAKATAVVSLCKTL